MPTYGGEDEDNETKPAAGAVCNVDEIRVGTEGAYPPWNFIDDSGAVAGFEIDLMNAICDHIGLECQWVLHEWEGILDALVGEDEGQALVEIQYDAMIASMLPTPERKERALFSGSHFVESYRLVFNTEATGTELGLPGPAGESDLFDGEAPNTGAFAKLRFATQVETHFEATMRTLVCGAADCDAVASVTAFETMQEARAAVATGEFDFLLEGAIAAAEQVAGPVQLLGPTLPDDAGAAIATRRDAMGNCLRHSFDVALVDLRANGVYDDLAKRYTSEELWGPETGVPKTCATDGDCGGESCVAAPDDAFDDRSICLATADIP